MIGVRFFCVCRVLFSMNTCADFCYLQNFGVLLRDLAVVMKFGCQIDRTIFLINDWNLIILCLPCIIFHKYADFSCLQNFGVMLRNLAIT